VSKIEGNHDEADHEGYACPIDLPRARILDGSRYSEPRRRKYQTENYETDHSLPLDLDAIDATASLLM